MIYLASPYSHPDESVRQERFKLACMAAAALLRRGHRVFCPIAHSHPIAVIGGIDPLDYPLWARQDAGFLREARALVVLTIDGWRESRGVSEELAYARQRNKPIGYMSPCGAFSAADGGALDLEARAETTA